MYNELYEIWRHELESVELEKLPSDFYFGAAEYLRKIKEESRMLDKRTVKARLLKKEMQNVKRMVRELIQTRYKKLIKKVAKGEKVPLNILTSEEEKIYTGSAPLAEAYHSFAEHLLRGQMLKMDVKQKGRTAILRFLKDVPAIIGADMKTYGPFKIDDIASLPTENAKILIKQGLAEKVEVN